MSKRRSIDLLGLVAGALDEQEQGKVASQCSRDPRLSRQLARWRHRLRPLEDLAGQTVDPPPTLAARTAEFVWSFSSSQVAGSSGVAPAAPSSPSENVVAETSFVFATSLGAELEQSSAGLEWTDIPPVAATATHGEPSGPTWISQSSARGTVAQIKPRSPTVAANTAPRRVFSGSAGPGLLAGIVSEAQWWKIVLAASAVVVIWGVFAPALYHSHLQAKAHQCSHRIQCLNQVWQELAFHHNTVANQPEQLPSTSGNGRLVGWFNPDEGGRIVANDPILHDGSSELELFATFRVCSPEVLNFHLSPSQAERSIGGAFLGVPPLENIQPTDFYLEARSNHSFRPGGFPAGLPAAYGHEGLRSLVAKPSESSGLRRTFCSPANSRNSIAAAAVDSKMGRSGSAAFIPAVETGYWLPVGSGRSSAFQWVGYPGNSSALP